MFWVKMAILGQFWVSFGAPWGPSHHSEPIKRGQRKEGPRVDFFGSFLDGPEIQLWQISKNIDFNVKK